MSGDRKPLSSYRAPRYWPVWIGMGLLRLDCLLPHRVALAIGRLLGRFAHAWVDRGSLSCGATSNCVFQS